MSIICLVSLSTLKQHLLALSPLLLVVVVENKTTRKVNSINDDDDDDAAILYTKMLSPALSPSLINQLMNIVEENSDVQHHTDFITIKSGAP